MYISQIALRDWKVYASASFDFPAPASDRNIILIGAPNGWGKSSLFEAIVLCLYGQNGLPLIPRAPMEGTDKNRFTTSYKDFLEKALHSKAIASGRASSSVKLTFIDDNGEPLEVRRVWHFSDSGNFLPSDEEIQIYEGSTRKAVVPDTMQSSNRVEWFQDYIERNLLRVSLANFFLFDGEQVSELAERKMSTQVKFGIVGLLGIDVLKKLAADLRSYASARSKEARNAPDKSTINKLEQERDKLMSELKFLEKQIAEIAPKNEERKEERKRLLREFASIGKGGQALQSELLEQINNLSRSIDDGKKQLEEIMMKDLALTLSGTKLRTSAKERLISEGLLERWESGKSEGESKLDLFISSVDSEMKKIEPALSDGQRNSIVEIARVAWDKLWHPPPSGCAKDYLHSYMNYMERSKAIVRMEELDQVGAPEIVNLVNRLAMDEELLVRKNKELTDIDTVAPRIKELQEKLSQLDITIGKLDQEIGAHQRGKMVLEDQINQKNTKLAELTGRQDSAEPSIRQANRANDVAKMVDEIVANALPNQVGAVADAMTKAYRTMAHKKDLVDKVIITDDCEVKLLNKEGIDLRSFDPSAGEKQIFTQALFSAVTSVSGGGFPMVVDTPLGRLDIKHRKGVLNHLADRKDQVILLSTDTEVVGEYLSEIAPHVQKKYLLDYEQVGDTGQSTARIGYFDEMEDRG